MVLRESGVGTKMGTGFIMLMLLQFGNIFLKKEIQNYEYKTSLETNIRIE